MASFEFKDFKGVNGFNDELEILLTITAGFARDANNNITITVKNLTHPSLTESVVVPEPMMDKIIEFLTHRKTLKTHLVEKKT